MQRCGFIEDIMASYLTTITSSTGIPLFIRSTGDLPQLSFPVVGSLNGVHAFTDNAKATLLSCKSSDVKIIWKNFHESLTLILITSNDYASDVHYDYLLTLVFNTMVMFTGFHNLLKFDDIENLKRELRSCYPLIDSLLSNQAYYIAPLTQSVEVIIEQDMGTLAESLTTFTNLVQSGYGCIVIHNQLLAATDSWWKLDSIELILLSLLPTILPFAQCIDIPVYLPVASNSLAHRLLIFHLYNEVYLMVLCDMEPPLDEAQKLALQTFLPLRDKILSLPLLAPTCIPPTVSLDTHILGLCYVNIESHKCVVSLPPPSSQESNTTLLSKGYQGALSEAKRRSFLIQFYKTVVNDILPLDYPEKDNKGKCITTRKRVPHTLMETYSCTKLFKGYAINKTRHNLFVLFDVNTPSYAMRNISYDVMESLQARNILST